MKKLYVTCFATLLAAASVPGIAADLTPDEGAELRARAEGLQAQRQRDPSWDGATRRVNEVPKPRGGDVKLNQNRGEVKAKPAKGRKKGESVTQQAKRSAKKRPGALVRKH